MTRLIHEYIEPERMILWDSKKRGGRPDTVQLLKDTWESFGAEVIFITSNMKGNDEMMQGCRAGEFLDFFIVQGGGKQRWSGDEMRVVLTFCL